MFVDLNKKEKREVNRLMNAGLTKSKVLRKTGCFIAPDGIWRLETSDQFAW